MSWTVLIPMKALTEAKSRLDLPAHARAELAQAMLADVISCALAVAEVRHVVVAAADPDVLAVAEALGATGEHVDAGSLNADLSKACVNSTRQPGGIAIVVGDLPGLQPDDLRNALTAAPATGMAFVAGEDGGTTILLARRPVDIEPHFGANSALDHGRVAADISTVVGPGARLDIDTAHALDRAAHIGLGPHTAAWARQHKPVLEPTA